MSTATVDTVSAPDPDETIRRTVRALRSAYDVDARVLARHLGISRNSLYNRLNGAAPWLAAEVVGLAQFFNCEIVDFYTGNVRIVAAATGAATGVSNRQYVRGNDASVTDLSQVRRHRGTQTGPALRRTIDSRAFAS